MAGGTCDRFPFSSSRLFSQAATPVSISARDRRPSRVAIPVIRHRTPRPTAISAGEPASSGEVGLFGGRVDPPVRGRRGAGRHRARRPPTPPACVKPAAGRDPTTPSSDRARDLVGVPDRVHDVLHPPGVAEHVDLGRRVAHLVVEAALRLVADREDRRIRRDEGLLVAGPDDESAARSSARPCSTSSPRPSGTATAPSASRELAWQSGPARARIFGAISTSVVVLPCS